MDVIRSPWRQAYVTEGAREPGCVLCRALRRRGGTPRAWWSTRAALNFVVMNLYPYNAGHVMVAPRRHVARLADATAEELAEMMVLARRLEASWGRSTGPTASTSA